MEANQLKEEIQRLKELKGEVKGAPFLTDIEYVRRRKGEEGVAAVERETVKLGWPIRYKEIENSKWYPVGLRIVSLLAIKRAFNWTDQDIFEMGDAAPKHSLMVRLLLRYAVSVEKLCQKASEVWSKHFSFGSAEGVNCSSKDKQIFIRLKDCKIHPYYCFYLGGWILRMFKFVAGKKAQIKETKCMFKGDPYHEYKITW